MAENKETKIKITFGFADSTTRKVELGPYSSKTDSAVANAKSRIKAFNVDEIADIYVSDDGAACTGIVAASYETVTDREIDLKD